MIKELKFPVEAVQYKGFESRKDINRIGLGHIFDYVKGEDAIFFADSETGHEIDVYINDWIISVPDIDGIDGFWITLSPENYAKYFPDGMVKVYVISGDEVPKVFYDNDLEDYYQVDEYGNVIIYYDEFADEDIAVDANTLIIVRPETTVGMSAFSLLTDNNIINRVVNS